MKTGSAPGQTVMHFRFEIDVTKGIALLSPDEVRGIWF